MTCLQVIALTLHYRRIHNTHDMHFDLLTFELAWIGLPTALQDGSSRRTSGQIGSSQIIKNKFETVTMLIGCFLFLRI